MPIVDTEGWEKCQKNNSDPYGAAVVKVAAEVMRALDADPSPIDAHKMMCDADKASGAGGITGFMAGCAANIVSKCHSRGEEFRKAWNKSYGVKDESKKGVVNPAIMTINTEG